MPCMYQIVLPQFDFQHKSPTTLPSENIVGLLFFYNKQISSAF